jgi:hypothetical protein
MSTQEIQTAERLARLETQHAELVRLMREAHDDMQLLKANTQDVKDSLTRWKGVGAGIVITVSVLWAGLFGIYKLAGGK